MILNNNLQFWLSNLIRSFLWVLLRLVNNLEGDMWVITCDAVYIRESYCERCTWACGCAGVCAASVSAVAKHRKSPGGSSEPIFKLIYSLVGMLIATATWKPAWTCLKRWGRELPYDPESPLLGIYPPNLKPFTRKAICAPMFAAAFLAWRQPKRPLMDDGTKLRPTPAGGHPSAVRRGEIPPSAATWTGLEIIVPSEVSRTEKAENRGIPLKWGTKLTSTHEQDTQKAIGRQCRGGRQREASGETWLWVVSA